MKRRAALVVLAGSTLSALAGPPTFTGVGDLAGGPFFSEIWGITSDGLTVVGDSQTGTTDAQAFYWSAGTKTAIGDLSGGSINSVGYAIADNGVIAGQGNGVNGYEAFKWHSPHGFRALGGTTAGGFLGSAAYAASRSGERVAGTFESAPFVLEACYWDGPTWVPMGYLPTGSQQSIANGISADGSVIVGQSDKNDGAAYYAFRWTSTSGMVELTQLCCGAPNSGANAVSLDGKIVVGYGQGYGSPHAVKWDENNFVTDLGSLNGDYSSALAVNQDGTVIVGRTGGSLNMSQAFVWTPATGMKLLSTVLTDAGIDFTGWTLREATAISANGRVIAGNGVNPSGKQEGWVVDFGSTCNADFNADGFVDIYDFTDFVTCFEDGTCPPGKTADYNQDGFADIYDFTDFVTDFEAGC